MRQLSDIVTVTDARMARNSLPRSLASETFRARRGPIGERLRSPATSKCRGERLRGVREAGGLSARRAISDVGSPSRTIHSDRSDGDGGGVGLERQRVEVEPRARATAKRLVRSVHRSRRSAERLLIPASQVRTLQSLSDIEIRDLICLKASAGRRQLHACC